MSGSRPDRLQPRRRAGVQVQQLQVPRHGRPEDQLLRGREQVSCDWSAQYSPLIGGQLAARLPHHGEAAPHLGPGPRPRQDTFRKQGRGADGR